MTDSNPSGGIRCFTVLLIVFVTLKLTGNIAWSWWWVLSPFWIPLAFAGIVVLFAVCAAGLDRRY